MLATGGSATAAITMLKEKGAKKIHFMCIIASPEGIEKMHEVHPDVDVFVGALDDHLNEHGYIVPGLGVPENEGWFQTVEKYEADVLEGRN